ncbi:MAG: GAF domain-containing SpoIIE family protein phosphatase [Nitrospirota bacterium]
MAKKVYLKDSETLKVLKKKVDALKILSEISAIISSTFDLDELLTIVMEKAKGVMNAEACSILLYNKETKKLEFEVALCREKATSEILKKKITLDLGQGIAGWVAEKREILIIGDVRKDRRFFQEADNITGFVTKSIIAAPLIGRRGLIGVAEIINPKKKEYDLEVLQILIRHFAIAIENAFFYKDAIERERLKQELEIASSLQKSFLPDSPSFSKALITVSAVNIPAKQVGGDLYDYLDLSGHRMGVFIGDVSGKGVTAALFMAKIISDFRYAAGAEKTPDAVMNRLNLLFSRAPRGMFLTATYLIIDAFAGILDISVAGHPPCLWITGNNVEALSVDSGPPLGIIPEKYLSERVTLSRGDRIILLTDGVFEARNKKGHMIGFGNLVKFVKDHVREGHLPQKIADYVRDFSKSVEISDDLTIVEVGYGYEGAQHG